MEQTYSGIGPLAQLLQLLEAGRVPAVHRGGLDARIRAVLQAQRPDVRWLQASRSHTLRVFGVPENVARRLEFL